MTITDLTYHKFRSYQDRINTRMNTNETRAPLCSDCKAKHADCAHGDLRYTQSCIDNRNRVTANK